MPSEQRRPTGCRAEYDAFERQQRLSFKFGFPMSSAFGVALGLIRVISRSASADTPNGNQKSVEEICRMALARSPASVGRQASGHGRLPTHVLVP
jgi:hypothetical protein